MLTRFILTLASCLILVSIGAGVTYRVVCDQDAARKQSRQNQLWVTGPAPHSFPANQDKIIQGRIDEAFPEGDWPLVWGMMVEVIEEKKDGERKPKSTPNATTHILRKGKHVKETGGNSGREERSWEITIEKNTLTPGKTYEMFIFRWDNTATQSIRLNPS